MLSLISANRLIDGRIVFRDARGGWTADVAAAARFAGKEELEAGLEQARADFAANIVVEIEPVALQDGPGGATPVTMRDRIRIAGPSVLQPRTPPATPVPSEQNDVSI